MLGDALYIENNVSIVALWCKSNFQVRLEHILERITLISEAANTERPSPITSSLFIGGALAARSVFTLQYLGITHILCLCSNEIGQSDSQYPELFEYKNFSVRAFSCLLYSFFNFFFPFFRLECCQLIYMKSDAILDV